MFSAGWPIEGVDVWRANERRSRGCLKRKRKGRCERRRGSLGEDSKIDFHESECFDYPYHSGTIERTSMSKESGLARGLCEIESLLSMWKKATSKRRNGEGAYEGE
jgi:hypothetical protein